MKFIHKFRLVGGLLLLAGSLTCLGWVFWPSHRVSQQFEISVSNSIKSLLEPVNQHIHESGMQVIVSLPGKVQKGSAVEIGVKVIPQTPQQPLLDTSTPVEVLAETRLDFPLLTINPQGAMRQVSIPQNPIEFQWTVQPKEEGVAVGRLWFYLVFLSEGKEIEKQAVISSPIQLQITSLFGLSQKVSTWCGVIFLVLSLIFLSFHKYSR